MGGQHTLLTKKYKTIIRGGEVYDQICSLCNSDWSFLSQWLQSKFFFPFQIHTVHCGFPINPKRCDNGTDSHCTVAITIIHRQLLLGQRLVGNVLSPSYFTVKAQQKVVKVYINAFSNNILGYIYCRIFFLHVSIINLTRKSKFMPTVCIITNSTHLMWKTYSLIAWFRFWLVKCVLKHYYFNYVNL